MKRLFIAIAIGWTAAGITKVLTTPPKPHKPLRTGVSSGPSRPKPALREPAQPEQPELFEFLIANYLETQTPQPEQPAQPVYPLPYGMIENPYCAE